MPGAEDPRFVEIGGDDAGPDPDEVVEHRPTPLADRFGRGRLLGALLIAALIAGTGLGYLSGRHSRAAAPVTSTVTQTIGAVVPAPATGPFDQLVETGARCSAQHGHQLDLGV